MKYINQVIVFLIFTASVSSQQIILNACNTLIDAEDYRFEQVNFANDRNSFETVADPMLGSRDCSGIGFCKLKIEWSTTNTRWEILADDGNDNFSSTYLLYYNDTASMPNPPSLMLGTWIEATTITESQCGVITGLSGAVQNSVLSTDDVDLQSRFSVYPNPVKETLYLTGSLLNSDYFVTLYDVLGKRILAKKNVQSLDVSKLRRGVYFLKIRAGDLQIRKKILVQ